MELVSDVQNSSAKRIWRGFDLLCFSGRIVGYLFTIQQDSDPAASGHRNGGLLATIGIRDAASQCDQGMMGLVLLSI
ncbi:hypothetical protein NMYAN_120110 [Nitrosomonas nitrosa]|uniref:Uncharacterized protein n=1 Tax=Nitrosomonas nitrosa TaxID=52442 RepID=A0A8H8YZN8_9PROT|nr:hypothetical protein NMYAN_120110 [Nitrosomonas nitrosa]